MKPIFRRLFVLYLVLALGFTQICVYADDVLPETETAETELQTMEQTETAGIPVETETVTETEETESLVSETEASETTESKDKETLGDASLSSELKKVLKQTLKYIKNSDTDPTYGSEWYVLGTARYLDTTDDSYLACYRSNIRSYLEECGGILTNSSSRTEYCRVILCLTAVGIDARDAFGFDMFSELTDLETVTKQGINGAVWSLIALNADPDYGENETSLSADELIDYILSKELSGGGWAYSGSSADTDMTAMCMTALSASYNERSDVRSAVKRGLKVLEEKEQEDGGFISNGYKNENCESCAQVIVALTSLGINPETDSRFIKNGCSPVDNLISFHISGSGFSHTEDGSVNGVATAQAFYALTAYERYCSGKTSLFDMSDVLAKSQDDIDKETVPKKKTENKDDDEDEKEKETSGNKAAGYTHSVNGKVKTQASEDATSETLSESSSGWNFTAESYEETGTDDVNASEIIQENETFLSEESQQEDNTADTKTFPAALLIAAMVIAAVWYIKKRH